MEALVIIILIFIIFWEGIKLSLHLINWILNKIIKIIKSLIIPKPVSFYCEKCNKSYKFNTGQICPSCGKYMEIIPRKSRKKIEKANKNINVLTQNITTDNIQKENDKIIVSDIANIIDDKTIDDINNIKNNDIINDINSIENNKVIKNASIKDKTKEEIERYLKSNDILYELPNMLIYDYDDDSPVALLNLLCKKILITI